MTLSDRFFTSLAALGARRGSDPAIFMTVWCVESGLNPRAMNPSGARGLNQMMPATLVSLGAPAEFENLSAEAQLPWIERLIASGERRNGGPFESAARYYHANFFPVTMSRGNTPDTIVAAKNATDSRERDAYTFNRGLDADGDGKITLSDLATVLERIKPKYQDAFARLDAAVNALQVQPWQPASLVSTTPKGAGVVGGVLLAGMIALAFARHGWVHA
jgi:hypothetical protein